MRSQVMAVAWGIWARSRASMLAAGACLLAAMLMNVLLPESNRFSQNRPNPFLGMVNFHLAVATILLTLSIFSYTEFDTQKSQTGFPRRLFVLPATAFQMVFVPMLLGVLAMESVALMWATFNSELRTPWLLVALPAYMVFYQSIQWTMSRLGSLRMLVMGFIGVVLIMAPIFRSPGSLRSLGESSSVSMTTMAAILACTAVITFVITWLHVSRQRSGGGAAFDSSTNLVTHLLDTRPHREKVFNSPAAAQFWFEWRRAGMLLPLLISGLLIVVIGPISWYIRSEPELNFQILVIVLAMPVLLAWPIGKGFSKPDFWSQDLSMSGFIAVKPIANADLVLIKMKAAAVSAIVSWGLVLAFLLVWLPFWGSIDSIKAGAKLVAQVYGPSWIAPSAIGILIIFAGILFTWRFLVNGLWLGLSGNKKLFMACAVPYAFFPLVVIATLLVLSESGPLRIALMNYDLSRLTLLEVIAAIAVIGKFWAWVFSWRDVASERVTQYLFFWAASTLPLLMLGIFLWEVAKPHLPPDAEGIRNLLLLVALVIVPLARVGYAPSALAKNRHRS